MPTVTKLDTMNVAKSLLAYWREFGDLRAVEAEIKELEEKLAAVRAKRDDIHKKVRQLPIPWLEVVIEEAEQSGFEPTVEAAILAMADSLGLLSSTTKMADESQKDSKQPVKVKELWVSPLSSEIIRKIFTSKGVPESLPAVLDKVFSKEGKDWRQRNMQITLGPGKIISAEMGSEAGLESLRKQLAKAATILEYFIVDFPPRRKPSQKLINLWTDINGAARWSDIARAIRSWGVEFPVKL